MLLSLCALSNFFNEIRTVFIILMILLIIMSIPSCWNDCILILSFYKSQSFFARSSFLHLVHVQYSYGFQFPAFPLHLFCHSVQLELNIWGHASWEVSLGSVTEKHKVLLFHRVDSELLHQILFSSVMCQIYRQVFWEPISPQITSKTFIHSLQYF